jgi:hypothetical protein
VLNNIALERKPDFDDDIEEGKLFECMMTRNNVAEPSIRQDARPRILDSDTVVKALL